MDVFQDAVLQSYNKCLPTEIQQPQEQEVSTLAVLDGNDMTTPLLYACQKEHTCALQYMLHTLQQQAQDHPPSHIRHVLDLWGTPTDVTDSVSGNTIFHIVAADHGITTHLDILVQIFKYQFHHPSQQLQQEEDYYYKSMCLCNNHGDTPLMMSCVNGNLELVQHWIEHCSDETKQQNLIQRIMDVSNHSNDTIITVSFGHGRHTILQYLFDKHNQQTQNFQLQITYTHYQKCQIILKRTKTFLQQQKQQQHNDNNNNNHHSKYQCMKQKLQYMEIYIQKIYQLYLDKCNQTMNELLLQEDYEKQQQSKTKKKKKKKRNKKKSIKHQEEIITTITTITTNQTNTTTEDNMDNDKRECCKAINDEISPKSIPITNLSIIETNMNEIQDNVTKMDDNQTINYLKETSQETNLMENDGGPTKSINNNYNDDESEQKDIPVSIHSSSSEAVMEALCLDSSMLLFTSHEMALHLSPSQLEAVETVLLNQLNSVKVATSIQSRLRSTNLHNPQTI